MFKVVLIESKLFCQNELKLSNFLFILGKVGYFMFYFGFSINKSQSNKEDYDLLEGKTVLPYLDYSSFSRKFHKIAMF